MRPLNILVIAAVDLPEGGGETTRLKTLVKAISAGGHKVQLLLENPSGNIDQDYLKAEGFINDHIPFRYILGNVKPLKGAGFFLSKYKAVKLLLAEISSQHKKEKIDVVWLNQLAFHCIYPVTRLCRKLGIKTVQSYEDDRLKGSGLKRRLIYTNQVLADKYLSKYADTVVAISHYLKEKYQRYTQNKVPVIIIPTIVETEKWKVNSDGSNTTPVLLYYGSFYGFDEIEKMINAIKLLKDRGKDIKFQMLGYNKKDPAYMSQIAQQVSDLGLNETIELVGFVKHAELKNYIEKADILIGIRKDDAWSQTGLSTKLSEYLSTGKMVICTAIGDNVRYLKNNEDALLLPPGCTVIQLADAIERAITSREFCKRIGKAGYQVALNNFDVNVVKTSINNMLYSIVNQH